jgi:dTDP-4-dehydrorhamnose 3,5-epimerase
MKVTPLGIDGAWLIESPTFPDDRGLFREWFLDDLNNNLDIPKFEVKQANTSISNVGVIRGIHYSSPSNGQAKLVTCTFGLILDAIVDLRENSNTFGKSITIELNSNEGHSVYISRGLGHAFQALGDKVAVTYLLNKKYEPELEFGIDPLDRDLAINWKPIEPVVSEKDRIAPSFFDQKSRGFHK